MDLSPLAAAYTGWAVAVTLLIVTLVQAFLLKRSDARAASAEQDAEDAEREASTMRNWVAIEAGILWHACGPTAWCDAFKLTVHADSEDALPDAIRLVLRDYLSERARDGTLNAILEGHGWRLSAALGPKSQLMVAIRVDWVPESKRPSWVTGSPSAPTLVS